MTSSAACSPTPPQVLRVALPVPLPGLFDYLPPPGVQAAAEWIGCRVQVPFGARSLVGVVAETGPLQAAAETLKQVDARLDAQPLLEGELWRTLQWCARYYHRPLGEVLWTALPGPLREGRPLPETTPWAWRLSDAGRAGVEALRAGTRPRSLAEHLAAAGGVLPEAVLAARHPGWRAAMRRLAARGFVERVHERAATAPVVPPPLPTPGQAEAMAVVSEARGFAPVLLEGVTGSGKTEVYLAAVEQALAAGRQALVLVPEIGLTPQTLRRFRARLPVEVLVVHSAVADGERARVWTAMARGDGRVLLGTRSAVFAPLPEGGLIVVDEEHDASYKQQDGLRYHARDLALVRGQALAVPVLLGSATPSLESLAQARSGRYRHLRLRQRATGAPAPSVRVVDLRRQRLEHGLSPALLAAVGERLAREEQVLVFRNRRGYAPVLLCHDCGYSARCLRCEAAMTVHGSGARLRCHHCGARRPLPPACPDCGGLALQPQGAGTERLEQALAAAFPDAPLVRVDRETTQGRDGVQKQFDRLGERGGILVGTQMLAKGHDLPRLTLVAVVGVDEGLFSADFRAPERLAQLLVQVSGRAGRAALPGEVLLQTHHPEHPLLLTLLSGGYPAFAALALAEREAAGLPPFGHLALLRAEAAKAEPLDAFLAAARRALGRPEAVRAHGPMPAPMPRRQGRLRGQLLLAAPQRSALQAVLREWVAQLYALPEARRVRWSIDVDPVDLY